MKILVTGGSGFLGSHIADELTVRGHDVSIFDNCVSKYIHDNQNMIIGSIVDKNDVLKGFEILSGNLFWFVLTILFSLCIILCIYTCKFYIWVRRDRIYSHKFVKYYNNAIIAGMWSVNLILFLNFIYGISYLYSVLKYGITIL